jgi:cytidylate kinase
MVNSKRIKTGSEGIRIQPSLFRSGSIKRLTAAERAEEERSMWKNIGYEQCLEFINCQLRPAGRSSQDQPTIKPAVTISRMTGSGGRTVAAKLAEFLQTNARSHCHWTVFDRNLIEKVLEDHHLPNRIAKFAPESHKSMVTDMMEELLGLHPSSWTLVQQTAESILHLAQLGHVILVGRGANVITSKLENVFHVRLVGSLEKRTERVQQVYNLGRQDALEFLRKEDNGRRHYLKEHFQKDIDDPTLYHLVVNTDRISYDETTRLIGDEMIRRFHLDRQVEAVEN